jgi:hypothetical protein
MPDDSKSYDRGVFFNCPFDSQYTPIFRASVYAVHACGYRVRCALEYTNSSSMRFQSIIDLIKNCRLGLHDLSRTETSPRTGHPRFNMPLEYGIFLGARYLGSQKHRQKSCLVMAKEPYDYQAYCSDIAGQDVCPHSNNPDKAIVGIRDWLQNDPLSQKLRIPDGHTIADDYHVFHSLLPELCAKYKWKEPTLRYLNLIQLISEYLIIPPPSP